MLLKATWSKLALWDSAILVLNLIFVSHHTLALQWLIYNSFEEKNYISFSEILILGKLINMTKHLDVSFCHLWLTLQFTAQQTNSTGHYLIYLHYWMGKVHSISLNKFFLQSSLLLVHLSIRGIFLCLFVFPHSCFLNLVLTASPGKWTILTCMEPECFFTGLLLLNV